MAINFIFSKDSDETHIMYTKNINIEIMIANESGKIVLKLFESPMQKHQKKNEKEK